MKNPLFELSKILRAVSDSGDPADQVKVIVDSIADTMAVDVCSLYMADDNADMVLVANHGVPAENVENIKIPAGVGLVGLTARSLHPVNIADAKSHEANYFVPGMDDREFQSFCGVPLVRTGKVIGVLVVQSTESRQFNADDEAFLVTLASQLALLSISVTSLTTPQKFRRSTGIRGAPGVAIGRALVKDIADAGNIKEIRIDDEEEMLERWWDLLGLVKSSLEDDKDKLNEALSEDVSLIFDAYSMLVSDPAFNQHVENNIREGQGLVASIQVSVEHFAGMFAAMEDPYLKSRHEDIRHIGRKMISILTEQPSDGSSDSDEPIVLVGQHLSVSDIADAMQGNLVGLVSGDGSSLSHSAVLANAIGIPAVMGVEGLRSVASGETLIVDGNSGAIVTHPTGQLIREYKKLIAQQQVTTEKLSGLRSLPAETPDQVKVNLYTNTGLLADIAPGIQNGAEGVGLYRTEIPFIVHETFPSEEEQFAIYRQVMTAYSGKPVYMRVLDIGSDKQLPYYPISGEDNPAMGWRGIRFGLDNSSLLMSQLRAMLRASIGLDNLHILIPMVSHIEELQDFRALLREACHQINTECGELHQPRVGIMVEVPVVISQLPAWSSELDFVSIGSNDLSQYLLAVDRNNARVASHYDSVHPGVISEIKRVVDAAASSGVPVCLCGEMATDPVAVILLLGLGVRTLSMSAMKIPYVKSLVRQVSIADCEQLLDEVLSLKSASAIRQHVSDFLDGREFATPIR